MAATVTLKALGRGRMQPCTLTAVQVSVDANSVSYATSLGGLAIDLYTALSATGTPQVPINGNDVVAVQPVSLTSPGKYMPLSLTLGTVTSTSVPCYIRLLGADGTATGVAGLAEIADGACTQTMSLLVLLRQTGPN